MRAGGKYSSGNTCMKEVGISIGQGGRLQRHDGGRVCTPRRRLRSLAMARSQQPPTGVT